MEPFSDLDRERLDNMLEKYGMRRIAVALRDLCAARAQNAETDDNQNIWEENARIFSRPDEQVVARMRTIS